MGTDDHLLPRRGFLQAGAATALFCTIGGETVELGRAGDAAKADALAARVRRPKAKAAQAATGTEAMKFTTPEPQPGGRKVEYWIQARTASWSIVPTKKDDWHGARITGRTSFRAVVYQLMTAGFASPLGPAAIPGPTLHAEVGDTIVVHFRNALTDLDQAVTMHPHGVRYNPEYDGAYMGDYTRAGGFVEPGEEFTYHWEATPDSVGAWPYHDHGPNHTLNTMRGLFGGLVVREKGASVPAVERVLFMHALDPPVTGLKRRFQCINGRSYAGNTPTIRAQVGQEVALHAIGMDNNFHDFHIHGHRWKDSRGGGFTDNPTFGPNETVSARFVEDNPGRWLYHCHVFSHQDAGMTGWYLVE